MNMVLVFLKGHVRIFDLKYYEKVINVSIGVTEYKPRFSVQ